MVREAFVLGIVLAVSVPAFTGVAWAHAYNHGDRHETCGVDAAPQEAAHGLADGHAHWHHHAAASEGHAHGGAWLAAGHTHANVLHDPCNQVGMQRPTWPDAGPFGAPTMLDAGLATGAAAAAFAIVDPAGSLPTLRLEPVLFPRPLAPPTDDVIIRGDAALAAMGYPGSGTPEDPYVIEGLHVRNLLLLQDTSACVVLRNNVIHSNALRGPYLNRSAIVDWQEVVARLTALIEGLADDIALAEAAKNEAAVALAQAQTTFYELNLERSALLAEDKALRDDLAAANADLAASRAALRASVDEARDLRADIAQILEEAELPAEPAGDPALDGASRNAQAPYMSALSDAAEAALAQGGLTAEAQETLAHARDRLDALAAGFPALAAAVAADEADLATAQAAYDAFRPTLDAFLAEYTAFVADEFNPAKAAFASAKAALAAVIAERDALVAEREAALAKLAVHRYTLDGFDFTEWIDLVTHLLELARLDAPPTAAGRLVLDWNGPCVHAYHNVVQDLRVNRNNARTGYATGGLIEDNRIFVVGQIRHFDGELRENEIGDRGHLLKLIGPTDLVLGRAINADGFNEANFHDNVVYGSVDLDLHGHHHGAGFFAPESHYHGSTFNVAYMVTPTGECAAVLPAGEEPEGPLPLREDPDLEPVAGIDPDPLLAPLFTPEAEPLCMPHHDHRKRWTSVAFSENVVIDPTSYGVRYEDHDHAGDDRTASSEDVEELLQPHFHRTHIALFANAVVGSVWIDVFNADGIELWSDDFSAVERDGLGRILDSLDHLGATILDSHPYANDGWVDVTGNAVLVPAAASTSTALRVNDAKQAKLLDVAGNRAFVLPHEAAFHDAADLLAWLKAAPARAPAETLAALAPLYDSAAPAAGKRAIELAHVADGVARVCGNAAYGFEKGLVATDRIRPDVALAVCGDNDWGNARVATVVEITPYPGEERSLLDPLRDLTEGSYAEVAADSAADEADALARRVL